jgi:hypothetical protein
MKNATSVKVPARLVSSKKFNEANTVAKVWMICNALANKARKDVIVACVEVGINFNTARTQYQQWFVEATSN